MKSRLKTEVIRIRGNRADLQVFEDTRGLKMDDVVEFTGELLSVELGPGTSGDSSMMAFKTPFISWPGSWAFSCKGASTSTPCRKIRNGNLHPA